MKLYDYVLSSDCYKVRLLAGCLGIELQTIPVNVFPGEEHRSPEFLAVSPLGKIPVLSDGGVVLQDAHAILVYLAKRQGDAGAAWYPDADAASCAAVQQWLTFATELDGTIGAARQHSMLGKPLDVDRARSGAREQITALDDHLTDREFDGSAWIVGNSPTIADVAVFAQVAVAGDGAIDLTPYKAVGRWLKTMVSVPGFSPMPGISAIR
ncbi:glutathione S-transferase [Methylobacterium oryzae]|uniref:Glutathione S-transferase n=1 Tax=Methylobacterium oryzae TaxID=334852 RepID=A0ABU7TU70_9HYPH